MQKLNASVPLPLPGRIKHLSIDERGYPVPWFVAWIDGKPDFRVVDPAKLPRAFKHRLCWICGLGLGRYMTFAIGPMCAINRISAEPPSHRECAEFAARACPFLTKPKMRRNEKDLPEDWQEPAGIMLARNPGVTCLWTTRTYKPIAAPNGVLFQVGDPTEVLWFAEGRSATREEVDASIGSGLPILEKIARDEGADAMADLEAQIVRAQPYLPGA